MAEQLKPRAGDLRVWHVPQIPGKPFHVSVSSPEEAKKILAVLADYDLFQLHNRIKPDYANAGGLEVYEVGDGDIDSDWCEWENADGETIDEVTFDGARATTGASS